MSKLSCSSWAAQCEPFDSSQMQTGRMSGLPHADILPQSEQAKKAVESAQRSKETLLERIRVTEGEISRATLNLKDAERRAEARASAEAQRDAAETERAQCSERLAQVDKAMRDSEPVLQRLRKDLRDFQEAFREKELAARETYDALVKGCDELQRSMDEVKRCRRLDTKSKIRKLDADIKAIAAQGKDQEEKMHEVRQAISKIEREEHDSKNMERNVDDNIRYKQLKETIAKLEEEIATRDIEGARKAKRQFDKDYEASRRKQTELQAEVRGLWVCLSASDSGRSEATAS